MSATVANDVTTCSAAINSYDFKRMSYCGNITLTTTTVDSKGAPIGTAVMEVSSSGALNPLLGAWEETDTLTLVEATGVAVESNVSFTASCTSSTCSATAPNPWVNGTPMVEGQTLEGIVTFEDVPNVDVRDFAALQYAVTAVPSGATPDKPATWTAPQKVRCDSTKDSTGCAFADVTPTVSFSLTDQGAAAATYDWALLNLQSHPGQTGFTYLTDIGSAKRNRTCGTASSIAFVPNTAVVGDSCDEYPFAATSEGGTDGGLCAEIIPQLVNGVWKFFQADNSRPVTHAEPCVRGHVPITQNKSAGGVFGLVVKNQRLIDTDKFKVAFTS
ncbi:hypothetical protein [Streptomyces sp. R08]|uniref:Deoxyribonuclease NucA/NucB domain-containing protein n=1 Tax=Streptomyces sp. R08 TaxID=3238624 RepID=A0AB39MNN4_9ACTN